MKLPKCEKDKVAGMITQGISYNKILDRVRETSGGSRASILEKQDILNVARDYGLHQIQSRHPEDSISVRFIVQELKEANELLFFKDQGVIDSENPNIDKKELALGFMKQGQECWFLNHLTNTETLQVCMDSTHCISQYAGYQLTTLMIVNDCNHGFPVAFLISSTINEEIVKAFLVKLKERVGPLNANTFMSDDDPIFRNAWKVAMSEVGAPVFLNCSWHTDRTFRKSIASKITAPTSEKAVIYQMVRALMDEPDEQIFNQECQGFLKYLEQAGFSAFYEYFRKCYLVEDRVKLCPKCYRSNVTITTNNHLESMHKLLKYIYLDGKKVKRLDHTILVLEKMVNDKLYSRMINLLKNRTVRRNKPHFTERHRQGKDLEVIQKGQGVFLVHSASYVNKQYEVKTCDLTCETCRERCPYCKVCKCMYSCSCEDNDDRRRNICKHIHAVVDFRQNKYKPTKPKDAGKEIEILHDVVCGAVSGTGSKSALEEEVEKLTNKTVLTLVPKFKDIKDLQVVKSIDSLLTKAIAVMNAATQLPGNITSFPVDVNTIKEPSNTNCVKQDRIYSTKKKRKRTDEGAGFRKPSTKARLEIGESLTRHQGDISVPVVSKGDIEYEHSY
ncbi:hypothetical protein Pcinc_009675 [Petrolisthes cinctipes]|uniref:SWIM-type domain-containing protein n=1 Tax=Petrolisthes cinctipes TaxID=88211 RepID=A0AAE1G6J4_PETCI|nr:hypothetical protein Pcinc_009675 [Petrolisthes cinctipes]